MNEIKQVILDVLRTWGAVTRLHLVSLMEGAGHKRNDVADALDDLLDDNQIRSLIFNSVPDLPIFSLYMLPQTKPNMGSFLSFIKIGTR